MGEFPVSLLILAAALLACGAAAFWRVKSRADLWVGSRAVSGWVAALSERVSAHPTWLFVAYPAAVMAAGLVETWALIGYALAVVIVWWGLAGPLRRGAEGELTLAGVLRSRFSKQPGARAVHISAALITLVFSLLLSAALLGSAGASLQQLYGVKPLHGVLFVGGLALLYTALGGFWASAWTDVICAALMVFAVALSGAGLLQLSSKGLSISASLKDLPELGSMISDKKGLAALGAVVTGLSLGLGLLSSPHTLSRLMTLKDERAVRRGRIVALSFSALVFVGVTVMGMTGISLYNILDLGDPERLFVKMATDLMPEAVAAMMLGAAAFATLSVVDALFLTGGAALAEDLLASGLGVDISKPHGLLICRACILAFGAVSILLAAFWPDAKEWMMNYALVGMVASLGPVLLLALRWSGARARGALWGLWIGVLFTIVGFEMELLMSINRMQWGFAAAVAILSVFVLRLRGPWLLAALGFFGAGRVLWSALAHGGRLFGPRLLPFVVTLLVVIAASLASKPKEDG